MMNMVYANQQAYYEAIAESGKKGDGAPFIDFMLQEISDTLKNRQDKGPAVGTNVGINVGTNERRILNLIAEFPQMTLMEMAGRLKISHRQCERIISAMRKNGLVRRVGPNKNGRWEIGG